MRERGNERGKREKTKKGKDVTMRGGAEDGTKGMKGNTRPDRWVRKVCIVSVEQPQTSWYAGNWRRTKILWYVSAERMKQWRRKRKREENQVGARCTTPGHNHEEDGDMEQAAEQETGEREMNEERRPSRSEREMVNGTERLPREKRTFPM